MICFGWYLCVLGNFDDFRFFFFWICEVGMDFGEKRVRFEWPKAIFFDVLHLLFVFGIRSFVFETSFFSTASQCSHHFGILFYLKTLSMFGGVGAIFQTFIYLFIYSGKNSTP